LVDVAFFVKLITNLPNNRRDPDNVFGFTQVTVFVVRIVLVRVLFFYCRTLFYKRGIARG